MKTPSSQTSSWSWQTSIKPTAMTTIVHLHSDFDSINNKPRAKPIGWFRIQHVTRCQTHVLTIPTRAQECVLESLTEILGHLEIDKRLTWFRFEWTRRRCISCRQLASISKLDYMEVTLALCQLPGACVDDILFEEVKGLVNAATYIWKKLCWHSHCLKRGRPDFCPAAGSFSHGHAATAQKSRKDKE